VTPGSLPHTGGWVEITADVTDEDGVEAVNVELRGSDGSSFGVLMTGFGDHYVGSVELPANFWELPNQYSVWISAGDDSGAFSSEQIGDVTVEAAPPFDEAPYVSDPAVEPRELPATGGTVRFKATATDNLDVAEVFATVSMPGGGTTQVQMQQVDANRYEGALSLTANPTGSLREYGVTVTAGDYAGLSSSVDAGMFTMAPALPPGGPLLVHPAALDFANVKVGKVAQRSLIVRNAAKKGTALVYGNLVVSGAGYTFANRQDNVSFVLKPGERRRFEVDFQPFRVGDHDGAIEIIRGDGSQAGLTVDLSGRGR
jgi:hypothetical protein